jgi:ATP-dependent protease HslVU (ClpYQ) peptidase subunit
MTCIAGIADGERVWMGGDSAVTFDDGLQIACDSKLWRAGKFLLGGAGAPSFVGAVRYEMMTPKRRGDDPARFVGRDLVAAMREALAACGFTRSGDDGCYGDGEMLVGYRGALYHVGSDLGIHAIPCGYAAIGSATAVALGALHALRDRPPVERLRAALEAAEAHSAKVRAPFTFEELKP